MSHATIRDRIEQFESIEGAGTELVTVTVPAGDSLASTRERVAREHAGAENIRSKRTRTRVRRALKRIQRLLRPYEETPESGLAVCAGVVDDDLVSAVFDDLPEPITESTYRCQLPTAEAVGLSVDIQSMETWLASRSVTDRTPDIKAS